MVQEQVRPVSCKKSRLKASGTDSADQTHPPEKAFPSGRVIMLGFTGSLGSGCTFLSTGLKDHIGSDAHYYKLSNYIRASLNARGITRPTIAQMQDEGNRLRRKYGLTYLVDTCVSDIVKKEHSHGYNSNSVILIDGIRNNAEVEGLRSSPNFYLVSVHSSLDNRIGRLVGRDKDFATEDQFHMADSRDAEEEGIPWGQKVRKCNDLADIIINNEARLPRNSKQAKGFISRFIDNYLLVMKALRDGSRIPDRPPSIDEALMTMAFCASLRSSCDKRKVGAVVARINKFEKMPVEREEDKTRYQVIASGYNEVPLGTVPCKLGKDEQCYRDRLREQAVKCFKVCPMCGKAIPEKSQTYEKLKQYKCDCGCQLSMCLPGAGDVTGKLLDMCKALHAEENALLALPPVSKGPNTELVLYTTTFPCNLCANKIVEAGVDRVVYTEPYPMPEAKEILDLGGVETRKFEGVKSSAYFRMYG
jgi:deoxycytidylate deaminase